MISVISKTLKNILTGSNTYTDVALRQFEIELLRNKWNGQKCQLNDLARNLCIIHHTDVALRRFEIDLQQMKWTKMSIKHPSRTTYLLTCQSPM